MEASKPCDTCFTMRIWLFSCIGIYFSVRYFKCRPYLNGKDHAFAAGSPILFYMCAGTQFISRENARIKAILNEIELMRQADQEAASASQTTE
mmetsp:Transcript_23565/g.41770  ORF Transcript_23565/g.41770 Transcript_23565/m.41770 type:complete len:93 (+) Transcript_23565:1860-2138(+)